MKIKLALLFIISLSMISCKKKHREFSILHYNIKELDSTKIQHNDEQLYYVKEIIKNYPADLISFNEVQYDMMGVPNLAYTTNGQNLKTLATLLEREDLNHQAFFPANTGLNATQKSDGSYYINANSKEARDHADQVNFGVFPAQYSTGAIYKKQEKSVKVISDLKWKDFNPDINFNDFATAKGFPLPDDMPLFDKNFTDISFYFGKKVVHVILLHTVPAFHFGNLKSPNNERNRDQLRFLEWYLTGKTDIAVNLPHIQPLKRNAMFIAVGDLNVDILNSQNQGAMVLKNLIAKTQSWIPLNEMSFTNESSSFKKYPLRLMLDYMIVSKNIEVMEGKVLLPNLKRVDLGCDEEIDQSIEREDDMILVSYLDNGKNCKAYLSKEYYYYKKASDHFPIWAKLKIK